MGSPVDSRLHELELIEKEIAMALQCAGQALTELSKEKVVAKQVESNTSNFLKSLETVENGLSKHINYLTQVSTSQPHEGSSYAAQKDLQIAFHRVEHVRSRLTELERMKTDSIRVRQQQLRGMDPGAMHRSLSQPGPDSSQPPPRSFSLMDQAGLGVQRSFSQPDVGQH